VTGQCFQIIRTIETAGNGSERQDAEVPIPNTCFSISDVYSPSSTRVDLHLGVCPPLVGYAPLFDKDKARFLSVTEVVTARSPAGKLLAKMLVPDGKLFRLARFRRLAALQYRGNTTRAGEGRQVRSPREVSFEAAVVLDYPSRKVCKHELTFLTAVRPPVPVHRRTGESETDPLCSVSSAFLKTHEV